MATTLAASSALSLHRLPTHSPAAPSSLSTTTARVTTPLRNLKPRAFPVAKSGLPSPGSVAEEEKVPSISGTEESSGDDSTSASTSQSARVFSPTACQACGKEEKVGGCNGEGRILGGLGSMPGFGWFPIKAYRPCPAFVEAGGRYKRQGQSLEEVAFGRKGKSDNLDIAERLQGNKKK